MDKIQIVRRLVQRGLTLPQALSQYRQYEDNNKLDCLIELLFSEEELYLERCLKQ
jgi:hypothetical protein